MHKCRHLHHGCSLNRISKILEEPREAESQKPPGEVRRWGVALLKYGLVIILALALYGAGLFSYRLLFPPQSPNEIKALQEQVQKMQAQLDQMQEQLAQLSEALTPLPQGVERVRIEASPDDDTPLGSADAPIVIVEFSDFQCPFCRRFWEQTLPQLKKAYVETGKVKFFYRDFPLGFHPNAQPAAEATECADEQGAYWAMHDHIFKNQAEWAGDALVKVRFRRYAEELRLDAAKFSDCLDSGRYAEEVQKDYQDGILYGVEGTPTFFINGYKVVGAQPFEVFKKLIEAKLKR